MTKIEIDKNLFIKDNLFIPLHELEFATSKSGGPGGQHVNKTESKITVRWNIPSSKILTDFQKELLHKKLASEVTTEGDIVVHASASRSQLQNKKSALMQLAHKIASALYIPKIRRATKASKGSKEKRLFSKKAQSTIKKNRSIKNYRE